jgi:CrcB protein
VTGLLVALGAAVGAPTRYAASLLLDRSWPWGTWLVNVLGSAVLGLLAALSLSGAWWALLATGFCGGFTSYSAFAVQATDAERPSAANRWYVVTTVTGALLACFAGYAVGAAL